MQTSVIRSTQTKASLQRSVPDQRAAADRRCGERFHRCMRAADERTRLVAAAWGFPVCSGADGGLRTVFTASEPLESAVLNKTLLGSSSDIVEVHRANDVFVGIRSQSPLLSKKSVLCRNRLYALALNYCAGIREAWNTE